MIYLLALLFASPAWSSGVTVTNVDKDSAVACHLTDGTSWLSPLTDAQLRRAPVPVSATIDTTGLATDTGQSTGNATLDLILGAVSSPLAVTGAFYPATQPVSGTFWQATQPVSIASMPSTPVTGTFWQATQPVSVPSPLPILIPSPLPVSGSFYQATQPVSGTFWQATQPVSLATAPTTPVTGTFWQATQPVSGTVTANAGTGTQAVSLATAPTTPVTGTFWQATQPVSGTVTANAGSGTMAVSGTFWQATQPVSAASLPLPSGASTDVAQGSTTSGETGALVQGAVTTGAPTYTTAKTNPLSLNTSGGLRVDGSDVTQPVSGTFWQATQPVSIASMPSTPVTGTFWQGTQPVSGTFWQATQPVSIASMPSTPVTGTFWQATQPVSISGTVTVAQATNGLNPCASPNSTLVSITGATSGTSAVQIVALSGTTKIYICSMTIIGVSGTSPTFSLVQGTGSNCATSQTKMVQSWATTAGTLYAFANPVAVGVAGNELCYLGTGTTPIQNYQINYVQQ